MERFLLTILLVVTLLGCDREEVIDYETPYNIILIAGQSNTLAGIGLNKELDLNDQNIKQLGRFGKDNFKVIKASEPLQHHSQIKGKIGFGLTFSKLMLEHYNDGKEILIIPCGHGGTGFSDNRWNKGNDLYEDAVHRVKTILREYPNSRMRAILWHQGETDIGNGSYQKHLDDFIANIRNDLGNDGMPFILGGMVPYWVNKKESRKAIQKIISTAADRNHNVRYVDPQLPFVIKKTNNWFDEVHYNANGQRELGKRYFEQFKKFETDPIKSLE